MAIQLNILFIELDIALSKMDNIISKIFKIPLTLFELKKGFSVTKVIKNFFVEMK